MKEFFCSSLSSNSILQLVRSYQIIYAGPAEEVEIETLLINRPKYPVQLILKRRTENK